MADERLQLTIQIERASSDLRISYFDAKSRPIATEVRTGPRPGSTGLVLEQPDPIEVAWSSIGHNFSYEHRGERLRGLDALTVLLDLGDQDDLLEHATQSNLLEMGHIMFDTLFGNSDRWEPVLRHLFDDYGGPRPNPPRRSVRVRIFTSIDALVDLPWRLTAWKGKFLVDSGWTFEVVASAQPGPDLHFKTPCPVLVIAPQFRGMEDIDTDGHLETMQQKLPSPYLTDSNFRVVMTRDEVRSAFLGMHPRVLYYYGHAEIRGGQMCLLLGNHSGPAEATNALDLKQLMGGNYPYTAYINACKSGASGWHSVGYQLAPDVPVVIANPTSTWSDHAGRAAMAWLERCLEQAQDPVIAAHAIDEGVTTRGFEWGMRTIHANYNTWRADPLASMGLITPVGLRLNRELSRERVQGIVTELARDDDCRVAAIISYAKPGNRIDLAFEQIKDQLEDKASHIAQVSWREVSFPTERSEIYDGIRRELEVSLGASPGEPLEHALRRRARGIDVPGAMPLLWLSWGPFGRQHNQTIGFEELRVWVELSSELAQVCPPDIRVVTFLTLETQRAPHEKLEEAINDLSLDHIQDPAFSCDLIPPLPDVSLVDIARFLSDRNNTRCPPALVKEVSTLIHRDTKGNFKATLERIEKGEERGWYSILKELRSSHTTPPDSSESLM